MPTALHSVRCDNRCDNYILTDSTSNTVICSPCSENEYGYCENCGEHYHHDYIYYSDNAGCSYCSDCYHERYGTCNECDEETDSDELEDGLCSDCQSNKPNTAIRNYSYARPSTLFKRIGIGPHYGLELEVQVRNGFATGDIAESILQSLDPDTELFWVAKEDGSLTHGFELESLPFSKPEIQKSLAVIAGYADKLKGFHGTSCGLHINCDRPESRLHVYKIYKFMNSESNRRLIETAGQRPLNSYCDMDTVSVSAFTSRYTKATTKKYSPVRIGEDRIEFRVFKANLLVQRVNKSIDFCQAVIDFTAQAGLNSLHEYAFLDYVWTNRTRYIDLVSFLLETAKHFLFNVTDERIAERRQAIDAFIAKQVRKAKQVDGTYQQSVLPEKLPELVEA